MQTQSKDGLGGESVLGAVEDAPIVGLLTRTLCPSPVIRQIIPARIRHRSKNDVIFVRDNSIEIMEYRDEILQHVIFRDDFGARIRSAGVFGLPPSSTRGTELNVMDTIIEQQREESEGADPMEVDPVPHFVEIPPQVLVMALEAGHEDSLLFLTADVEVPHRTKFTMYQQPLPASDKPTERLGKHIAVDPKSRAMAVSAQSGCFSFYKLKSMVEIKADFQGLHGPAEDPFKPLKAVRHMKVGGTILRMDFLHPPRNDDITVILLLVVSIDERTKLVRYEWDSSRELSDLQQMDNHPVEPKHQCPLLLIPFAITMGFLLVCEDTIGVYDQYHTKNMSSGSISIREADEENAREPGSSKRFPLWTAWAKPVRRKDYAAENDVFYLCREDGIVRFLEFSIESLPAALGMEVGSTGINVDTAFAALNREIDHQDVFAESDSTDNEESKDDIFAIGEPSYDLLVAAGDLGDGCLIRMEARREAVPQQSIPNWTPMIDSCTVTKSQGTAAKGMTGKLHSHHYTEGRQRIFGCGGRGVEQGRVYEIRSGIEAQSVIRFNLDIGVVRFWVLPDVSGSRTSICVLLTHPDDTTFLLRVENDCSDGSKVEALCGIDNDLTTIAAGSTMSGIIVQITRCSLRAIIPGLDSSFLSQLEKEKIVLACIEGRISAALIAIKKDSCFRLRYGIFSITDLQITFDAAEDLDSLPLDSEPSCVFLQALHTKVYAFIGTNDCLIQVYEVDSRSRPSLTFTHQFDGDGAICESIGVICREQHTIGQYRYMLLCGLRNGLLQIFNLIFEGPDGLTLRYCEALSLGNTSVIVLPDTSTAAGPLYISSQAIISCGENLCRLVYHHPQREPERAYVQNIWMVAQDEPGLHQSSISALGQADPWHVNSVTKIARLFFIEGSVLHITNLESSLPSHAVVRSMKVPGTPNRILYSRALQKIIVAFTTLGVIETRPNSNQTRSSSSRLLFPSLMLLDPDDNDEDTEPKPPLNITTPDEMLPERRTGIVGPSGMKILGLTEWRPFVRNKEYILLVVNTLRARMDGRPDTGSIKIFALTKKVPYHVGIELKETVKCDAPVYSVASYGSSSLVYTSGNTLNLLTLNTFDGALRWSPTITYNNMGSPGVSLSVEEPYFYVGTAKHSISVFKLEGNELRPQISEDKFRSILSHTVLPAKSIVLAGDKSGKVAGLWQPSTPKVNNSLQILFETVLPSSLRKIHRAAVGAPWFRHGASDSEVYVGSAIDGSFYQLELMDEAKWRLLRFLQNLSERNAEISSPRSVKLHKRHIEPSTKGNIERHVDGDILMRMLERGQPDSGVLLKAMLKMEPDQKQNKSDFATAADREKRFRVIAETALGDLSGRDPVDVVVSFLRVALELIL